MTRRSLIFDTTIRLVFDAVLLLSVYLLFAGHNQPGGGFVGGLVTGGAIALRFIAGGYREIATLLRLQPWTFLSIGLCLATATAVLPLAFGDPPLDHQLIDWDVALLGHVKFTTAAFFDTGVYFIVLGVVLMIFEGLADDELDDIESLEEAP